MSTLDRIFKKLEEKQPLMKEPTAKVEMTVSEFKSIISQVFEKGRKEGKNDPFGMADLAESLVKTPKAN